MWGSDTKSFGGPAAGRGPVAAAGELCEGRLEIRMPARKRGAVQNDVVNRPLHAALVHDARHGVVGTKNVKVRSRQALQHKFDYLRRRPGRGWLFAAAGHAGEGKTRDQQVCADVTTVGVAQRMGER